MILYRLLIEHLFLLLPEGKGEPDLIFMGIVQTAVAFVELGKLFLAPGTNLLQ